MDNDRRTPLSYAAGNGHVPAVQLLLEKRADIDFMDNDRRTPLWYAAEKGHVAVVQLLLDKGAEIQPGSVGGWVPQSYLDTSSDVLQLIARDTSKKETGMVGLLNQGALGYLNVVLQSFYHIKAFREAVHRIPTDEVVENSAIWALQRLFYSLQASIIPVSTQELTDAFGWNQSNLYMLYQGQDAFEMWELLLDRIEQKMPGYPIQNAVSDLFSGKAITSISCTHVDNKTSRLEGFYSVSLDVDGNRSLDDSFREYTKLEYYGRYGLQDAVKSIIFQDFPPVLVVRLKWFTYNIEQGRMESIFQDYEFPEEFDATPYLVSSGMSQRESWIYTLYGVIMHRGDMSQGYYNAFLRPTKDGSFYKFDNHRVTRTTLKDIKDANFGERAGLYSWKPTILIYIRKSSLDYLLESAQIGQEDLEIEGSSRR
ncbi:MAG: hypothetical protein Q9169_008609 [Polycauliona sp. 2 TL-2023]